MRRRVKNVPLIIAVFLILIAGVGFYTILQNSSNLVKIAVAKENLAAYTFVDANSFDFESVPKGAVGDNVLTQADYEELFKSSGEDEGTTLTYPFLKGQWILEDGLSSDPDQSFAVVRPDERVVAATTTPTGVALFTIRAGDVVDVAATEGSLAGASFVKVICIATEGDDCRNVLPAGQILQGGSSGGEGGVQLLLAVPEGAAGAVAGQSVSLTLNPFCGVDREGFFISRQIGDSEGNTCEFPAGRDASSRPVDDSTALENSIPGDEQNSTQNP